MSTKSAPKAGKKRSSKAAAEDYESDDGFVRNDDNGDAPKSKKVKTGKQARELARHKEEVVKHKKDEKPDDFWEISDNRRVTLDSFKGKVMVGIREYYEDKTSGKMLPGKKGISLSLAQYAALLKLLPEVEAALIAKGESVPRPDFGSERAVIEADAGDDEEEEEVEEAEGKKNFEATSDEEE
ncbi:MAG: hypothetical protein Q9170_005094 [Blastenia crenularia]